MTMHVSFLAIHIGRQKSEGGGGDATKILKSSCSVYPRCSICLQSKKKKLLLAASCSEQKMCV